VIGDHDFERAVRAWISEGSEQLPDLYLDAALEEVATTPQAHGGGFLRMWAVPGGGWAPATAAILTVVAAAIVVLMLLPRGSTGPSGGSPAPEPTPIVTPSPVPTPIPTPTTQTLVSGDFQAFFGTVRIAVNGVAAEVSGSGANVSGSMDASSSAGEGFLADLQCARSEAGGILLIGGTVTESTHPDVVAGTRVAIVFQAGDPVAAGLWFEGDTLARTCSAFLRRAPDLSGFLQPIEGTVELAR
jgi:hypothetical protein